MKVFSPQFYLALGILALGLHTVESAIAINTAPRATGYTQQDDSFVKEDDLARSEFIAGRGYECVALKRDNDPNAGLGTSEDTFAFSPTVKDPDGEDLTATATGTSYPPIPARSGVTVANQNKARMNLIAEKTLQYLHLRRFLSQRLPPLRRSGCRHRTTFFRIDFPVNIKPTVVLLLKTTDLMMLVLNPFLRK